MKKQSNLQCSTFYRTKNLFFQHKNGMEKGKRMNTLIERDLRNTKTKYYLWILFGYCVNKPTFIYFLYKYIGIYSYSYKRIYLYQGIHIKPEKCEYGLGFRA